MLFDSGNAMPLPEQLELELEVKSSWVVTPGSFPFHFLSLLKYGTSPLCSVAPAPGVFV